MVDIRDLDISKNRVITEFANNNQFVKTNVLVPRRIGTNTFRLNIPAVNSPNDTFNDALNTVTAMARVEREYEEYLNGERCDRCGARLFLTTATRRAVGLCKNCDEIVSKSVDSETRRATAFFNILGMTSGRII